jgi:hypothetical protein
VAPARAAPSGYGTMPLHSTPQAKVAAVHDLSSMQLSHASALARKVESASDLVRQLLRQVATS